MSAPLSRDTILFVVATERAESPLSSTAVTSAPLANKYLAASLWPALAYNMTVHTQHEQFE